MFCWPFLEVRSDGNSIYMLQLTLIRSCCFLSMYIFFRNSYWNSQIKFRNGKEATHIVSQPRMLTSVVATGAVFSWMITIGPNEVESASLAAAPSPYPFRDSSCSTVGFDTVAVNGADAILWKLINSFPTSRFNKIQKMHKCKRI